ncbi:MAG: hypothetical protein KIS73_07280 [Enhydrobacter sp.]|nr:hypothetical protein [Enhydrobacter sp.]
MSTAVKAKRRGPQLIELRDGVILRFGNSEDLSNVEHDGADPNALLKIDLANLQGSIVVLRRLSDLLANGPEALELTIDWQLRGEMKRSPVDSIGVYPARILKASAKQMKFPRKVGITTGRETWKADGIFGFSTADQPYYAGIALRRSPVWIDLFRFEAAFASLPRRGDRRSTVAFRPMSNDAGVPNMPFRVLAPLDGLASRRHAVELFASANFHAYSTVVFSQTYRDEDRELARHLKQVGTTVVLDLFDNLFCSPSKLPAYERARRNVTEMVQLADRVICSTPALADVIAREAGRLPVVVGDPAEDIARPEDCGPATEASLLWYGVQGAGTGSPGMEDLLLIKEALIDAQIRWPFELVIIGGSREKYDRLIAPLPLRSRYVEWSMDGFARELYAAAAVLLPLADNAMAGCESHHRLTTALNAGIPVIADSIQAYDALAPFCYVGNWEASLEAVLTRTDDARQRASGARGFIQDHWSPKAIIDAWEQVLSLRSQTAGAPDAESSGKQKAGSPAQRFQQLIDPPPGTLQATCEIERLVDEHVGPRLDKWHQYLGIYDRFFAPFRQSAARVLELGVSHGGSLVLWRRYFGPDATIVGLDVDPRCATVGDGAARVVIGDQSDRALLRRIVEEMGGLDIVIDDGSHLLEDQRAALEALFPLLSENGLYVCEDLHTSYWPEFGGGYRRPGFIELVKDLIDQMHGWYHSQKVGPDVTEREVFGLHVFDSIVVLEKRAIEPPYRVIKGRLSL